MIIESVHELVPPETIRPVVEKIINNFITEQCHDQNITVGLNAIREILMRQPLALDEGQVEHLIEFRSYRNKSVMAAARSLINFFREVCPALLPKKYLGRDKEWMDKNEGIKPFGYEHVATDVDGAALLKEDKDGVPVAAQRLLTDKDLKKIRVLKQRMIMRRVDKHGFRSDDEDDKEKENDEVSSDHNDSEEGESEMDEEYGEEEMEEDVSEDEEAPALVEMDADVAVNEDDWEDAEEGEEESSPYESSMDPMQKNAERDSVHTSEIGSSRFSDSESEKDAGYQHGFRYAHHLDTFRKGKKDRMAAAAKEADKLDKRDAHKRKRDVKEIGKSNTAQKKNKPAGMTAPKKVK